MDAAVGCKKLDRLENERDMWGEGGSLVGLGPGFRGLDGIGRLSNESDRGDDIGISNSNWTAVGDRGEGDRGGVDAL